MENVNKMRGYCDFPHIIYKKIIEKCGYPDSIIELGCGNGGNLDKFSLSCKRIGIDPEPGNIKSALHRNIDCEFIEGEHNILQNYQCNEFDVAFTVSVLDHIEDFTVALSKMLIIAKEVILLEPLIKGVERLAFKNETHIWNVTWYHNYESYLKNYNYTIEPCPLYKEKSGPLYHLIHVK